MENWTWGLSLIALTIMIHATGIAFMSLLMFSIRDRMQARAFPVAFVDDPDWPDRCRRAALDYTARD